MRNTWTLARIRMRLALRSRVALFFSLILPVGFLFLYVAVFGSDDPRAVGYVLAAVLALTVMGSFWGMSAQLVSFRERGILRRFRLAPVGPAAMIGSSILSNFFLILPTAVLECLLARWIFGLREWGNLAGVALLVLLGAATFSALGLVIASVTNTLQETQVINNSVWFAFLILSGATVPLPVMPEWLQRAAMFLPATYLVTGLQQSLLRDAPLAGIAADLAALAVTLAVAFLLSVQLFRWEPEEKVSGRAKLWAVAAVIPFLVLGVWENARGTRLDAAREVYRDIDVARLAGQPADGPPISASGFVSVEGGRLYFEEAGEGPPLVLLHSGLADRRMWEPQWKDFARRFRVIRYDARGFGKSDLPAGPYSPVGDLRELLRARSVERAILVGVSMGGHTALDFGAEHPDMVAALVPVAAGLSGYEYSDALLGRVGAIFTAGKSEGPQRVVELWLADPMLAATVETPEALAWLRPLLEENADGFLTMDLAEPLNPPAAGRLERIQAPVLVVVGERDDPEIRATAEYLEQHIPSARRAVIPGAGHLVNLDRPEEFNRVVLEFLAALQKN